MHHSPEPFLGWLPWSAAVAEFIEAKENPLRLKNWIKTRERNEALDLEVSCLAALYILGPGFVKSLPERAAALARRAETPAPVPAEPAAPAARRSGWITGGRG
jgi:phage terminase large subunit GpA-like protein